MTTTELLEERVARLEKQVYGLLKTPDVINKDEPLPESTMVENLLHANTLISSALSGRDEANAVIKRLPELNNYMDPVFESSEIPIEAKVQMLLIMENNIRNNYSQLSQIQELMSVLDTDRLRDVPELTNKLNKLNLSYLKLYEDSEQLNARTNEIFSKYNEVITSISKSLITLDACVTAAEIAAMPKKQVD